MTLITRMEKEDKATRRLFIYQQYQHFKIPFCCSEAFHSEHLLPFHTLEFLLAR